jgi:hypothetical protein
METVVIRSILFPYLENGTTYGKCFLHNTRTCFSLRPTTSIQNMLAKTNVGVIIFRSNLTKTETFPQRFFKPTPGAPRISLKRFSNFCMRTAGQADMAKLIRVLFFKYPS